MSYTMLLTIANHGPEIIRTNFFDLPEASFGKIFVSINAGAFRLLVPPTKIAEIAEMGTASYCVVSRGPMEALGLADAFEILFDDRSENPYAIHLSPECFDRLPLAQNEQREWILSAWTSGYKGRPHKAFERPCWYRVVPWLPYMKAYPE
jgi:hypothetical protein